MSGYRPPGLMKEKISVWETESSDNNLSSQRYLPDDSSLQRKLVEGNREPPRRGSEFEFEMQPVNRALNIERELGPRLMDEEKRVNLFNKVGGGQERRSAMNSMNRGPVYEQNWNQPQMEFFANEEERYYGREKGMEWMPSRDNRPFGRGGQNPHFENFDRAGFGNRINNRGPFGFRGMSGFGDGRCFDDFQKPRGGPDHQVLFEDSWVRPFGSQRDEFGEQRGRFEDRRFDFEGGHSQRSYLMECRGMAFGDQNGPPNRDNSLGYEDYRPLGTRGPNFSASQNRFIGGDLDFENRGAIGSTGRFTDLPAGHFGGRSRTRDFDEPFERGGSQRPSSNEVPGDRVADRGPVGGLVVKDSQFQSKDDKGNILEPAKQQQMKKIPPLLPTEELEALQQNVINSSKLLPDKNPSDSWPHRAVSSSASEENSSTLQSHKAVSTLEEVVKPPETPKTSVMSTKLDRSNEDSKTVPDNKTLKSPAIEESSKPKAETLLSDDMRDSLTEEPSCERLPFLHSDETSVEPQDKLAEPSHTTGNVAEMIELSGDEDFTADMDFSKTSKSGWCSEPITSIYQLPLNDSKPVPDAVDKKPQGTDITSRLQSLAESSLTPALVFNKKLLEQSDPNVDVSKNDPHKLSQSETEPPAQRRRLNDSAPPPATPLEFPRETDKKFTVGNRERERGCGRGTATGGGNAGKAILSKDRISSRVIQYDEDCFVFMDDDDDNCLEEDNRRNILDTTEESTSRRDSLLPTPSVYRGREPGYSHDASLSGDVSDDRYRTLLSLSPTGRQGQRGGGGGGRDLSFSDAQRRDELGCYRFDDSYSEPLKRGPLLPLPATHLTQRQDNGFHREQLAARVEFDDGEVHRNTRRNMGHMQSQEPNKTDDAPPLPPLAVAAAIARTLTDEEQEIIRKATEELKAFQDMKELRQSCNPPDVVSSKNSLVGF